MGLRGVHVGASSDALRYQQQKSANRCYHQHLTTPEFFDFSTLSKKASSAVSLLALRRHVPKSALAIYDTI
jgi:hypothetical protein